MRRLVLLIAATLALVNSAAADEWTFVWVSSGINEYSVANGKAKVSRANGMLEAQMIDEEGVKYTLRGTIRKGKVTAAFTILESDYFSNSPFSGTYVRKQWFGFADSKGRESISLSDGWNFIGLVREIRQP